LTYLVEFSAALELLEKPLLPQPSLCFLFKKEKASKGCKPAWRLGLNETKYKKTLKFSNSLPPFFIERRLLSGIQVLPFG
jgi:hypothetical protein